ncbi:hypothetical protein BGX26_006203 [Mortierella sp. AD094]|nr:hypothetical protein BGX26_006203 [Mortierella sp. AD094]
MPSIGVTTEIAVSRIRAIRVFALVATGLIVYYNFITSCSPFYSPTYYDSECAKALVPVGTQVQYPYYKMTTTAQIDDYDGSSPQNCYVTNVMIQEYLATESLPLLKFHMNITCNDGLIGLTIDDYTTELWNRQYGNLRSSATIYKNITDFGPGAPFDAIEYKFNWTDSDSDTRLFRGNTTIQIPPTDTRLDRSMFQNLTGFALSNVNSTAIPGMKYLCNRCGAKASWRAQTYSLAWQYFYNTFNTVISIYGTIVMIWTYGLQSDLKALLTQIKNENVGRGDVEAEGVPLANWKQ